MRRTRRGLASARTRSGEELLGTRDALVTPDRVLPWETVHSAEWDSESGTLTVVLLEPEVLLFELDDPALLLQLVRERVTASIVLVRRVDLAAGGGFTVMARRPPSGGEIAFTFEYDRALDPDDRDVQEAARQALRDARGELGM